MPHHHDVRGGAHGREPDLSWHGCWWSAGPSWGSAGERPPDAVDRPTRVYCPGARVGAAAAMPPMRARVAATLVPNASRRVPAADPARSVIVLDPARLVRLLPARPIGVLVAADSGDGATSVGGGLDGAASSPAVPVSRLATAGSVPAPPPRSPPNSPALAARAEPPPSGSGRSPPPRSWSVGTPWPPPRCHRTARSGMPTTLGTAGEGGGRAQVRSR